MDDNHILDLIYTYLQQEKTTLNSIPERILYQGILDQKWSFQDIAQHPNIISIINYFIYFNQSEFLTNQLHTILPILIDYFNKIQLTNIESLPTANYHYDVHFVELLSITALNEMAFMGLFEGWLNQSSQAPEFIFNKILANPYFLNMIPNKFSVMTQLIKKICNIIRNKSIIHHQLFLCFVRPYLTSNHPLLLCPKETITTVHSSLLKFATTLPAAHILATIWALGYLPKDIHQDQITCIKNNLLEPEVLTILETIYIQKPELFIQIILLPEITAWIQYAQFEKIITNKTPLVFWINTSFQHMNLYQLKQFIQQYVSEKVYPKQHHQMTEFLTHLTVQLLAFFNLKFQPSNEYIHHVLNQINNTINSPHPIILEDDDCLKICIQNIIKKNPLNQFDFAFHDLLAELQKSPYLDLKSFSNHGIYSHQTNALIDEFTAINFINESGLININQTKSLKKLLKKKPSNVTEIQHMIRHQTKSHPDTIKIQILISYIQSNSIFRHQFLTSLMMRHCHWQDVYVSNLTAGWKDQSSIFDQLLESAINNQDMIIIQQFLSDLKNSLFNYAITKESIHQIYLNRYIEVCEFIFTHIDHVETRPLSIEIGKTLRRILKINPKLSLRKLITSNYISNDMLTAIFIPIFELNYVQLWHQCLIELKDTELYYTLFEYAFNEAFNVSFKPKNDNYFIQEWLSDVLQESIMSSNIVMLPLSIKKEFEYNELLYNNLVNAFTRIQHIDEKSIPNHIQRYTAIAVQNGYTCIAIACIKLAISKEYPLNWFINTLIQANYVCINRMKSTSILTAAIKKGFINHTGEISTLFNINAVPNEQHRIDTEIHQCIADIITIKSKLIQFIFSQSPKLIINHQNKKSIMTTILSKGHEKSMAETRLLDDMIYALNHSFNASQRLEFANSFRQLQATHIIDLIITKRASIKIREGLIQAILYNNNDAFNQNQEKQINRIFTTILDNLKYSSYNLNQQIMLQESVIYFYIYSSHHEFLYLKNYELQLKNHLNIDINNYHNARSHLLSLMNEDPYACLPKLFSSIHQLIANGYQLLEIVIAIKSLESTLPSFLKLVCKQFETQLYLLNCSVDFSKFNATEICTRFWYSLIKPGLEYGKVSKKIFETNGLSPSTFDYLISCHYLTETGTLVQSKYMTPQPPASFEDHIKSVYKNSDYYSYHFSPSSTSTASALHEQYEKITSLLKNYSTVKPIHDQRFNLAIRLLKTEYSNLSIPSNSHSTRINVWIRHIKTGNINRLLNAKFQLTIFTLFSESSITSMSKINQNRLNEYIINHSKATETTKNK